MKSIKALPLLLVVASMAAWADKGKNDDTRGQRDGHDNVSYSITDLGTLGGPESFANSLNDDGTVVGMSRTSAGSTDMHAFVFRNGKINDIFPFAPPLMNAPKSINNEGLVVGVIEKNGVKSLATFDTKTNKVDLLQDDPEGTLEAAGINDEGQIVGDSYTGTARKAFIFENGQVRDLGSLGGFSSTTTVSDEGMVAGSSTIEPEPKLPNSLSHAFLIDKGKLIDIDPSNDPNSKTSSLILDVNGEKALGISFGAPGNKDQTKTESFVFEVEDGEYKKLTAPGGGDIVAFAMNDDDDIVGSMGVAFNETCLNPDTGNQEPCTKTKGKAFIFNDGVVTDLNSRIDTNSGWDLNSASDINNNGQIVGFGLHNGLTHAFLLTPKEHHDGGDNHDKGNRDNREEANNEDRRGRRG